jgi:heptaprenyl diphosphate synthase
MARAALPERLGIDLAAIDAILESVVESDEELPRGSIVYESIIDLIRAGGKRLRPIMVIVGGRFGDASQAGKVMRTAALFEYIHMASLIHDDIIDNSDTRRGRPALHVKTNVRTALHVANYMMARIVEWSSMNERREISEEDAYRCAEIAGIVTELCLGEFKQLDTKFNFSLTMEEYLDKTRRKTALLMAECLKHGAKAAKAPEDLYELLHEVGEALGMAFQIRDDLLDFTRSKESIGKPAGADLRNGNITLPVIVALRDPELAPHILRLGTHSSDEEMERVIHRIAASRAIDDAREIALAYATKARETMLALRAHPAYRDLEVLADHFLD